MKLLDYLNEKRVNLRLKKCAKRQAIECLVDVMLDSGVTGDRDEIIKALMEREETGSTGIGNGVAVPHAKTDDVDALAVVYGYSREGVDFDSVDKKPAHFFFLVLSPAGKANKQLRILARIARVMHNNVLRTELKNADTSEKVIKVINRYDS